MRKPNIKKFALETISDTLKQSPDLTAARGELAFAIGSAMEVSGTIQKVVKRDGQSKLVIQPASVPELIVFADCPGEAEKLRNAKFRKGSPVAVRGLFAAFGASAVNLSACRLTMPKSKIQHAENVIKC